MSVYHERVDKLSWVIVVIAPVLAGGIAALWTGATTSARDCTTGSGSNDVTAIGLGVLWLLVPLIAGLRARRAGTSLAHAALPVVVGAVLAAITIFLGFSFWWAGHNCYT